MFFILQLAHQSADAAINERCDEALPISLGSERGDWISAGSEACYRVDVDKEGLLFAETRAATASWISVESCDSAERTVVEARSRVAMKAAARSYAVCVSSMDPRESIDGFRLDLALVSDSLWKSGGEDDRELEVDPQMLTGGEDDRELEVDPQMLTGGEDDRELEVDPQSFTVSAVEGTHARMCRDRAADDYADMMACANPITATVEAEIRNDWNDDADVFSLETSRLRAVRITSTGDVSLRLEMIDGQGHVVASTEIGNEMTTAVPANRYFLRVTGEQGTEGTYSLNVEALR